MSKSRTMKFSPHHHLFACRGAFVFLALAFGANPVMAQGNPWARLVGEADSIGPVTPQFTPGRGIQCGSGIQRADSVQISGTQDEFLFASRSIRTRGYFTYHELPATGAGRFSVRRILCDDVTGRPTTFVLERDHRYFYLAFSLREHPTFRSLTFLRAPGDWSCFVWEQMARTFAPGDCQPRPGSKC